MGTDRKINAAAGRRTVRAAAPAGDGPDQRPAAAAVGAAEHAVTTLVRRFRRGRWTVTALAV